MSLQPPLENINLADDFFLQGFSNHQANLLQEAERFYQLAINADPKHAKSLHFLGLVFHQTNRSIEGLKLIEQSIEIYPSATAYVNLGLIYEKSRQPVQAKASYMQALAINKNLAEAHFNLGNVLSQTGDKLAALLSYEKAVAIKPTYMKAVINLAGMLSLTGRHDEAILKLRSLLAKQPDSIDALRALSQALHDAGDYEAAINTCKQVIALDSANAESQWSLSHLLLLTGDWPAGWQAYEWRWRTGRNTFRLKPYDAATLTHLPDQKKGSVLVRAEQGLGDSIQFVRYLPLLTDYFEKVYMETPEPLLNLFRNSIHDVDFLNAKSDLPECNYQVPLLSVPRLFNQSVHDAAPLAKGYLVVENEKKEIWYERIEALKLTGLRVGLVWSGNQLHPNDFNRSMPLLSLLHGLPENHTYFCLQKELSAGDIRLIQTSNLAIQQFCHLLNDFSDTAALCSHMDVVISVDTSVAHLAGALGRPVILLLPEPPDWRWLLERSDTPWYKNMHLLRRPPGQDWMALMPALKAHLQGLSDGYA